MKNLLDFDFNLSDFHSVNDDELAVMAKSDKNAAAAVVSRYSKLIYVKSRIFANFYTDCDDLFQEGLMALFSAVGSYTPDKGAGFSTFAEVCIENRMKSLLSKGKKSEAPVDNIDELSDSCGMVASETPESVFLYKEYLSELLCGIRRILSESEFQAFELYIQGFSYRYIAGELKISEKSVDNAMQRARRKIRAFLQKESAL